MSGTQTIIARNDFPKTITLNILYRSICFIFDLMSTVKASVVTKGQGLYSSPRHAGVFGRTRPAGGGQIPPLPLA